MAGNYERRNKLPGRNGRACGKKYPHYGNKKPRYLFRERGLKLSCLSITEASRCTGSR